MQRIVSYVLNKVRVALLSSLLQGLFFLILSVVRSRFVPYDTMFGPFWALALFSQIYSIPAYVLAGIPCSMLIDAGMYWMNIRLRVVQYLAGVVLYALSGIFVIVLFQHFTQTGTVIYVRQPTPFSDALRVGFDGGLPALLFYHTSLLLGWSRTRRIRQNNSYQDV